MNIQEISDLRRERLNAWFDALIANKRFKNGKEICDYYGVPVLSITALLNSKRVIGEKAARELEQQFGLAHLYLDQVSSDRVEEHSDHHVVVQTPCFEMQLLGQGLFQLQLAHLKSHQNLAVESTEQYWLIVKGEDYIPVLHVGWALLCTSEYELGVWQLYVVKLITGACLILQLNEWDHNEYRMRSLDGKRQLTLLQADLEWIHAVVQIMPRRKR